MTSFSTVSTGRVAAFVATLTLVDAVHMERSRDPAALDSAFLQIHSDNAANTDESNNPSNDNPETPPGVVTVDRLQQAEQFLRKKILFFQSLNAAAACWRIIS